MQDLTKTLTEDHVPVWPHVRFIDGKLYTLESEHATMEAALERVQAIRAKGGRAQAFESDRPKFGGYPNSKNVFPAFAVVYHIPMDHIGQKGEIVDGKVTWSAKPPKPVKEKKPRMSKKAKPRAEKKGKKPSTKTKPEPPIEAAPPSQSTEAPA